MEKAFIIDTDIFLNIILTELKKGEVNCAPANDDMVSAFIRGFNFAKNEDPDKGHAILTGPDVFMALNTVAPTSYSWEGLEEYAQEPYIKIASILNKTLADR